MLHYYTGSDEVVLKVPRQGTPAPQLIIVPLIVMLTRRRTSQKIFPPGSMASKAWSKTWGKYGGKGRAQ